MRKEQWDHMDGRKTLVTMCKFIQRHQILQELEPSVPAANLYKLEALTNILWIEGLNDIDSKAPCNGWLSPV